MKNLKIYSLVVLSLCLFSIVGCKKDSSKSTTTVSDPSSDSPVEDLLKDTFYVVAYRGSTNSLYTSHTLEGGIGVDSSWSNYCSVPEEDFSTSAANIVCLVEGHELDLYYSGVRLKLSVPKDLCAYVEEQPYYYFKFEPGQGSSGPYAYSATDPADCPYNYTSIGGPNCCIGDWTMLSGGATLPGRTGSWGGSYANCLSGSSLTDFKTDANGRPMLSIVQDVGSGVDISRTMIGPIDQTPYPYRSNVRVANYFNPADHAHVSTYYPAADLLGGTTAPAAFDIQMDPVSSVTYYTSAFHTFSCLDANHETKARIRVMVREWNTNSALELGGDSDITGSNGVDVYNDFRDWKDFNATYPGLSE